MGLVLSSHVRHRGKRNPLRAWHNELGMPMPIWQAVQTSSGIQASGKRQRGSTTSWSSRRCAAGPSPRTSVVQRGLGAAGPLPPCGPQVSGARPQRALSTPRSSWRRLLNPHRKKNFFRCRDSSSSIVHSMRTCTLNQT